MNIYATQKNLFKSRLPGNTLLDPSSHYKKIDNEIIRGGTRTEGYIKKNLEEKPLVSVVTSVWNREKYIEKAICSVLEQDYDNLEYIIIDGSSSDGTIDIIRKYSDAIDFFLSAPDSGIYDGMNRALSFTSGQYILILNSDDWYLPETVSLLLESLLAMNDKADFVSALAYGINDKGIIRKIPKMKYNERSLFRMQLRHETMLIPRRLYKTYGLYDPSYSIIGDSKFTSKLYAHNCRHHCIDKYIMYFRESGISHTVSDKLIAERCRLIMENFPFLENGEAKLLSVNISKPNYVKYKKLKSKYKSRPSFIQALDIFFDMPGL